MASVYKRGGVFWVRFRVNGHHVRRSAHTAKKPEAAAFLQRLLGEYAAKARGDRPRHLYEDAAARFLDEASIRPKTLACYATSNRSCLRVFAGRYLDDIDRRLIAEFVSRRKKDGVSDTTVRRDLAYLSSMCTLAIRWGWLDTNPVTIFNKRSLKESRPRTRFLTHAEYEALLAEAAEHVRPAIVLATATGLRKEELFSLTVTAIDLPRREIVLDRTKSGTPRRVPLSDAAILAIQRVIADKDRPRNAIYLFTKADGGRYGDVKKGFAAACRRARITGLRWHDLRHTFASWFIQSGGDLYHLSRILGHSTVQMTTRYSHLRTQDIHIAMERAAQNWPQDRLTNSAN
ncbi:site-specific integrase [Dankookia rubra]|uniref:Site-specific integrase n=1 Tax=Dankookia rubra TaxID=1442381 RepID=A0A4R5Q551_9PROT|nr:site-specific integrase [Dankookia rubra]TDH58044.1 site-specific integrase [Dankookia rubra]